MTTPINDFKDAVATIWAATTPPDRLAIRYRRLTGKAPSDGTAADRAFWFEQSRRVGVDSEATGGDGNSVSYTRWSVEARVRLSAVGRGIDRLENAVNNETNLLCRAVELHSGWPAGVLEVLTVDAQTEFDDDSDDAVLSIAIAVLTAETDGN